MPNLNRVILMGNLTRDPDLHTTPNNNEVCNIRLAVNRMYKASDGERKEETTFLDAEAWRGTARLMDQHFQKGDPIMIEGHLKQDRWKDKDGSPRSKLYVVVERLHFTGLRNRAEGNTEEPTERKTPRPRGRRDTKEGVPL